MVGFVSGLVLYRVDGFVLIMIMKCFWKCLRLIFPFIIIFFIANNDQHPRIGGPGLVGRYELFDGRGIE